MAKSTNSADAHTGADTGDSMSRIRAHQRIREARQKAGLSPVDVASGIGLTISEYEDIEQYADEFTSSFSLAKAKALCVFLGLDVVDVVEQELLGGNLPLELPTDFRGLLRKQLLRKRRQSLGLSEAEVADAIGFEHIAIHEAEAHDRFLDTLPIQVLADLAKHLQLPLRHLL
jgi:transcriptional regulator with XRE-family HTH domain